MEIRTERLKLRSVEKIDLEKIHSLLMYPESALFNPSGFPDGIAHTEQMVEAWAAQINEFDARKDYTFYIETLEGKEFIGLINISVVKMRYRNAEVWFKLVPTMWNKGYATEALNRILTFGFKELNFHRIEGGCAVENIASAKVMEKVGMVKEAHRRKILPLKDGWSDNYEFAILEEEYPH